MDADWPQVSVLIIYLDGNFQKFARIANEIDEQILNIHVIRSNLFGFRFSSCSFYFYHFEFNRVDWCH